MSIQFLQTYFERNKYYLTQTFFVDVEFSFVFRSKMAI